MELIWDSFEIHSNDQSINEWNACVCVCVELGQRAISCILMTFGLFMRESGDLCTIG